MLLRVAREWGQPVMGFAPLARTQPHRVIMFWGVCHADVQEAQPGDSAAGRDAGHIIQILPQTGFEISIGKETRPWVN